MTLYQIAAVIICNKLKPFKYAVVKEERQIANILPIKGISYPQREHTFATIRPLYFKSDSEKLHDHTLSNPNLNMLCTKSCARYCVPNIYLEVTFGFDDSIQILLLSRYFPTAGVSVSVLLFRNT